MLHTTLNQPDKISFDSFNDPQQQTNNDSNLWSNTYSTPILQPRTLSLTRATIPLVNTQLLDYQLVFFYYSLATATTAIAAPSGGNPSSQLRCVRLYPRNFVPPVNFSSYTANQYCATSSDLVALLNTATTTDSVFVNNLWVSGDITFYWDSARQQIYFKGNTAGVFYCAAGYNDPNVIVAQQSATFASTYTNPVICYPNPTAIASNNFAETTTRQPFCVSTTLNEKLGYTYSGLVAPPSQSSRSVPGTNGIWANSVGGLAVASGVAVYANSFPNLVGTQALYVYSTVAGSSGYSSTGRKDLLAVIPTAGASLTVLNYIPTGQPTFLTKLVQEIYSLDIELRDDNNMPYALPDSANVQIELAVGYDKPATLRKEDRFA